MTTESLIAQLRATADVLEKFNELYERNIKHGWWSPDELRYEADYLEKNQ